MPSIKAIGIRLKSVSGTAKITKAMKMVAASKLKGAERKMLTARPFAASINSLMDPKLTPTDEDTETPESTLLMAISSDKGLCGGINSRVVKAVKLSLDAAGETKPDVRPPPQRNVVPRRTREVAEPLSAPPPPPERPLRAWLRAAAEDSSASGCTWWRE